jgi:hypothetical protein
MRLLASIVAALLLFCGPVFAKGGEKVFRVNKTAHASSLRGRGGCHGTPYFGKPSQWAVSDGSAHRKLLGKIAGAGALFEITVPNSGGNASQTFLECHVWGSGGYAFGKAQGELISKFATGVSVKTFIDTAWTYLAAQIGDALNGYPLPAWLKRDIEILGLEAALDATYLASVEFTPPHFYDELRGLSDSTGVDYTKLRNVHMIAGFTQGGTCSEGVHVRSLMAANSPFPF